MGSGVGNSGASKGGNLERAVDRINALARGDESGRYSKITKELDKFKTGDMITLYSPVRSGDAELPGIVDNPRTFTRTENGEWQDRSGRTFSNGDLRRTLDAYGNRAMAGEPDISSHVQITGSFGREYGGLRYAKGVYDIARRGDSKAYEKVEQEGQITGYNGTQYGVVRGTGANKGYHVTHIPTGLKINNTYLKTLTDVSNYIKQMDAELKSGRNAEIARTQTERFARTIRGDVEKRVRRRG